MFEQLVKQEFLVLYAKFQAGARWLAERQAKNQDNSSHLLDFRRLEARVDQAWESIPEAQKDEIIALLTQNKAIPEAVSQAKELFAGQLVKIT